MKELIALCWMAVASVTGLAGDTEIFCISEGDRMEWVAEWPHLDHAAGWYDGNTNTVYVMNDMGYEYTVEVLYHELAHAWDLEKGTLYNGEPSYFSATQTGFDVEEFARLQTLWLDMWPENEVFPDVVPTLSEWEAMERAGWLMPGGAPTHTRPEPGAPIYEAEPEPQVVQIAEAASVTIEDFLAPALRDVRNIR